jgi:rod shape-determining protein MreC
MELQPPPFFNRGPAPLVRLTFFVALAGLLMVLDARFHAAETLRAGLALLAYPIQRVAMAPVQLAEGVADFFSSQVQLQRENDALREKQLRAARDLMTMEALAAENAHLRGLLEARERLPRTSMLAEILYAARDPFSHKVIIDKGTKDGIEPGLPVVDDIGVIGQVTRAYPMLAEVTLITDKDQAIPVQVLRNGLRAVAYGAGDGATLDLRFMAANVDIQNGDVLMTSGIDGTYPSGIPVAKVSRIERDAAYAFAKISCAPAAGTDRNGQVLVLGKDANLPAAPEAEPAQPRPARGKRARRRE